MLPKKIKRFTKTEQLLIQIYKDLFYQKKTTEAVFCLNIFTLFSSSILCKFMQYICQRYSIHNTYCKVHNTYCKVHPSKSSIISAGTLCSGFNSRGTSKFAIRWPILPYSPSLPVMQKRGFSAATRVQIAGSSNISKQLIKTYLFGRDEK